jgi:CheY-like chemotaxis protein
VERDDQETTHKTVIVDVLIVEDDEQLRASMADLLTEWGFAVGFAGNGREALDLVAGGVRPRLVLLDLQMPVMDGWGFLDARKGHPHLASVPVALITAEKERPFKAEGVFDMLEKPVPVERLLGAVRLGSTAGAEAARAAERERPARKGSKAAGKRAKSAA